MIPIWNLTPEQFIFFLELMAVLLGALFLLSWWRNRRPRPFKSWIKSLRYWWRYG